jgi:hypothetical protein
MARFINVFTHRHHAQITSIKSVLIVSYYIVFVSVAIRIDRWGQQHSFLYTHIRHHALTHSWKHFIRSLKYNFWNPSCKRLYTALQAYNSSLAHHVSWVGVANKFALQ